MDYQLAFGVAGVVFELGLMIVAAAIPIVGIAYLIIKA